MSFLRITLKNSSINSSGTSGTQEESSRGSGGNDLNDSGSMRKKIPSLTLNPVARSAITSNARKSSISLSLRRKPTTATTNSRKKGIASATTPSAEDGFLRAGHQEDCLIMRIVDENLLREMRESMQPPASASASATSSNGRRKDFQKDFLAFEPETFHITFFEDETKKPIEGRSNTFIKNDRNGVCVFNGTHYPVLLVDLPCIIESQKTFDHKRYFKTCDIAQMLIIGELSAAAKDRLIQERYSWPHGITPPLKEVRRRRFRKRASKKVIEDIESEVRRLLEADAKALEVNYKVTEFKEEDDVGIASEADEDDELKEADDAMDDDDDNDHDNDNDDDDDDAMDDMLQVAEEIENAMMLQDDEGAAYGETDDEDDDDAMDDGDDDEEDDEEDEAKPKEDLAIAEIQQQLQDEMMQENEQENEALEERALISTELEDLQSSLADLEQKISEKEDQLNSTANPIMKERFRQALGRLQAEYSELEQKQESLAKELQQTTETYNNDDDTGL